MDTTADDNFFIEEPQKLGNNFFSKDKSLHIVELLAQKHKHGTQVSTPQHKKAQQFHPFSISYMMRKPESKSNSAEHITQLLRRVQHTLDYREHKDIDWLLAALDDHFVELVKSDDTGDIIDNLSAYVDSQCALLREIENTKCLLKPIADLLESQLPRSSDNSIKDTTAPSLPTSKKANQQNQTRQRIYHKVDHIEF